MVGEQGDLCIIEFVEPFRFLPSLVLDPVDGLVPVARDALAKLAILLFQL
jgi:hypothetical protein